MNGRILHFDGRRHGEAQRLLPWLVNGRLEDDEQAWLEQHVAGCSDCRGELDALRALHLTCLQSEDTRMDRRLADADAGWRRLRARLQPPRPAHAPIWQALLHRPGTQGPRWLGWALAAQALTITVLGVALWTRPPAPASYRTLGAAPGSASGNLIIVFDPHLNEVRLRGLLRASEARIVDGPNDAGAYVLAVPTERLTMVRDALRAAPGVTLVAALGPEPAR